MQTRKISFHSFHDESFFEEESVTEREPEKTVSVKPSLTQNRFTLFINSCVKLFNIFNKKNLIQKGHNIGVISRFLIFCSGASIDLLEKCPRFETTKYVGIGLTVFFTALLAVISSFFAFSLIFDQSLLIVLFSLFWGAIIFNLDRYIVSTMRHSENKLQEFIKVIPRLIIALLIAVIISKPLEVQIFKSEIHSYLMLKNAQEIADVDLKYTAQFAELSQKIHHRFSV